MDPGAWITIVEAVLRAGAALWPAAAAALTGGRSVDEAISAARAAVQAIPARPAGTALDAHEARVRARDAAALAKAGGEAFDRARAIAEPTVSRSTGGVVAETLADLRLPEPAPHRLVPRDPPDDGEP
jgi:hypothetical protein